MALWVPDGPRAAGPGVGHCRWPQKTWDCIDAFGRSQPGRAHGPCNRAAAEARFGQLIWTKPLTANGLRNDSRNLARAGANRFQPSNNKYMPAVKATQATAALLQGELAAEHPRRPSVDQLDVDPVDKQRPDAQHFERAQAVSRGHGLTDQSQATATSDDQQPRRGGRRRPARWSRSAPWGTAAAARPPSRTPPPRARPARPMAAWSRHGAQAAAAVERQAQHRPGQHERGPRKQGERAFAGVGPEVPLERVGPGRQPRRVTDGGRRHRDERRAASQDQGPPQTAARQPPDARRRHDGRPHDVQDVDLQQASGVREPAERCNDCRRNRNA